jgi:hypothetical protein
MYLHFSVLSEADIAGNRLAQFHVTKVAQLQFHVALYVNSNLKQRLFFYETIVFSFTKLI